MFAVGFESNNRAWDRLWSFSSRVIGNSIHGAHEFRNRFVWCDPEFHVVSIFTTVLVIVTKQLCSLEPVAAEENLGSQIALPAGERYFLPVVRNQLVLQLRDQHPANTPAANRGMNREVEDVQTSLVQFVDHEASYMIVFLGDHSDAVPLAQAAEKIVLGPGIFEARSFGTHHFRHIPADHPADVNPRRGLFFCARTSCAHERTPS